MTIKVSFCHADPCAPFWKQLNQDIDHVKKLDVAVAFFRNEGKCFFLDWFEANKLSPDVCRLFVSVQFPTDLDALCELYEHMKGHLYIYRGGNSLTGKLLHSKIVYIERESGEFIAFVGSHNWTCSALSGKNMEASVCVRSKVDRRFFRDVRSHLKSCCYRCEEFNPDRIDSYRQRQWDLYQAKKPRKPATQSEETSSRQWGVVLKAEWESTDRCPESLFLYIPVKVKKYRKYFSTEGTPVHLILFPKGALQQGHPPETSSSRYYKGEIVNSRNRKDRPTKLHFNAQLGNMAFVPTCIPVAGEHQVQDEDGVISQAVIRLNPSANPIPSWLLTGRDLGRYIYRSRV